ncbi:MAG: hypothetical protein GEV04_10235 [Actinophytocola sp.]|nr:hypothetical protein [Actinophytocola sp.]
MERVSGIAGVFVPSGEPTELARWYADALGARPVVQPDGVALFADVTGTVRDDGAAEDGWTVSFDVSDLGAMVEQLRGAGAVVESGPVEVAVGRVALLRDPENNVVRLVEPAPMSRIWSADPAAVRALGDTEQPTPPAARRPRRRRWAAWLPLLLVGVLVGGFIAMRQSSNSADAPTPPAPTNTGPGVEPVSVTEIGRPVLGVTAGWELIARGRDTVSRIALAEGRVTTTKLPGAVRAEPTSLVTGPNWVFVQPVDPESGYLVPDGELARVVHWRDHVSAVFPGPRPRQVWVEHFEHDTPNAYLALHSLTGKEVTGPYVPATDQTMADGAGNVLVRMTSGTYLARRDGVRRVTTGRVEGVGRNHFLVVECDERARCVRILVSRATGQRRVVTPKSAMVSPAAGQLHAIAPDGSIAVTGGDGGMFVDNLASGGGRLRETVLVRPGSDGPGVVFSPDSEWLFGVGFDGDIVAIDTDTFEQHELDLPLPDIRQLAIRPVD